MDLALNRLNRRQKTFIRTHQNMVFLNETKVEIDTTRGFFEWRKPKQKLKTYSFHNI